MRGLCLVLCFLSMPACRTGLPHGGGDGAGGGVGGGGQPTGDMHSTDNMQPSDLSIHMSAAPDLAGPTLDLAVAGGDLAGPDCLGVHCKASEICLRSTQGLIPGCVPVPNACSMDRTCACLDGNSTPGTALYSLCHANPGCTVSSGGAQVFCPSGA